MEHQFEERAEDVIAFVRCEFVDEALRRRYMPSWLRLLDGARLLTPHQANAWVMSVELAEEVAHTCNHDPAWQTITVGAASLKSDPLPVKYVVVKYRGE